MIDYPVDAVLDVVRFHTDPVTGWAEVVGACELAAPDAPWSELSVPDIERDVREASEWLRGELGASPGPRGLYLGLDTLNMDDGAGANVEFGWVDGPPDQLESLDWLEDALSYGGSHLQPESATTRSRTNLGCSRRRRWTDR